MPYSIFFTKKGHAIHGTNHRSLGRPASHGCVRLSVAHAAVLWDLVAKHKMANTMIVLTGRIPASDAPVVARNDPDSIADEETHARPVRAHPGWFAYRAPRGFYYRERGYYRPRGPFGGFPFGW